jgi:hypothetical protein
MGTAATAALPDTIAEGLAAQTSKGLLGGAPFHFCAANNLKKVLSKSTTFLSGVSMVVIPSAVNLMLLKIAIASIAAVVERLRREPGHVDLRQNSTFIETFMGEMYRSASIQDGKLSIMGEPAQPRYERTAVCLENLDSVP